MYPPPPPNFSTDLAFFQKMVFFAIGGGGGRGGWGVVCVGCVDCAGDKIQTIFNIEKKLENVRKRRGTVTEKNSHFVLVLPRNSRFSLTSTRGSITRNVENVFYF